MDFTRVIELKPDYIEAYVMRAAAYEMKKDWDRAILDYTKIIKLKPNDAQAYYDRGNAYGEKGEREAAISDLKKARELTNDSTLRQKIEELLKHLQ